MRWFVAWCLSVGLAFAEGEKAGEFDYYVLSLSWSPNWCALEGNERGSEQCAPGKDHGWVLHGLWPQYESGWPSYCKTSARNPSRSDTRREADLFGSSGSAWHQWNKHGRCSGLRAHAYYDLSRQAYDAVERPEILRKLRQAIKLPANVIEAAFLEANPELTADMLTVTCKSDRIQEVRICLTKDLEPRECSGSVARDCRMQDALFAPISRADDS